MEARVIVSEDTKKKCKMTRREIGKKRFARLVEADKQGTLQLCRNRWEVAQSTGCFMAEEKIKAQSWVFGLIKYGYLTENVRGFDKGHPVYEYHLTGKTPDYDYQANIAHSKKVQTTQTVQTVQTVEELNKEQEYIKLEIAKQDTIVKLEIPVQDDSSEMLESILKVVYG